MACFDKCLKCLSLVPWGTLIATVICWAGTALFCGTGHEALTYSYQLLNSANITGFSWNTTQADEAFQSFKYAIYGIASYMFLLSVVLFVDGVLSTRTIKSDYEESCKTSVCGLCVGIFYTVIAYVTGIAWLVMICFMVLPVYFMVVVYSQCIYVEQPTTTNSDFVCLDFVQSGLMHPDYSGSKDYGRLCGDDLKDLCKQPEVVMTYQLFIIALVGAALVVLSMKQYAMCLTANFAYVKMTRKLAVYEDAKYKEEMELNDIINTARSNERLTYKY
ncbi:neuronal membrane glycoprotein M6-b-like [Clavelina lepadiformis]|uniref:neuronal membrane glycoprotein M6-b-like n=1 Tax=Clavelina lepadiformis TaxID=159417 RepID=UPI004042713E